MTIKTQIANEIETLPPSLLQEVLGFIEYLKFKQNKNIDETIFFAETSLTKDWSTPPILEFDPDRDAFIRPEKLLKPLDISERAVFCFFADAIEKVLAEFPHKIVAQLKGEGLTVPVYELNYNGQKINLAQAIVGAPWAAGHIEEMTTYGCRKYIACCGAVFCKAIFLKDIVTLQTTNRGGAYVKDVTE